MTNAATFRAENAPLRVTWRSWLVIAWFTLWIAIYAAMGVSRVALEVLLVIFVYFLASTPVRAVPGWFLVLLFGIGNVIIPWTTVALQIVTQILTTKDDTFLGGVIAPVSEEIMKILPIVILYAWPRPKLRYAFGATDWMLCGMAIGSGVEVWEDVLTRYQGTFPASAPHFFGIPLISGFTDNGRAVFIGHVGATAMIALALGWSRYLKRVVPGSAALLRFAPAAIALVWMIVDHAGNNLRAARQWYWALANFIYFLGGRGRLAVYVFLIAVAATIVFETVMLARAAPPQLAPVPPLPPFELARRKVRRLIRSHQMQYVQLACGLPASNEGPGWNVVGFLRRSMGR